MFLLFGETCIMTLKSIVKPLLMCYHVISTFNHQKGTGKLMDAAKVQEVLEVLNYLIQMIECGAMDPVLDYDEYYG
jgi:hypothetical protein